MQLLRPWRAIGALLLVVALLGGGAAVAAGSWTATGKMTTIRYGHTLTALPDGRAVAIGGFDDYNPIAAAELYEPAGGAW